VPTAAQRTVLGLALAVCLGKGLFIAAVTPPFQTPDEYGHYDYVLYLSYIRWGAFLAGDVARPTGYNDITTDELWAVTRATGTEGHLRHGAARVIPPVREQLAAGASVVPGDSHARLRTRTVVPAQFNYPVLYYGAAAGLANATRVFTHNPVVTYYVVRFASLAMTLVTVWLIWWMAVRSGFGTFPLAAATAFIALHPQLGMLATSVQSDVLTILLTTLAGACALAYASSPSRRRAAVLGVVIGALLLTKLHAAVAVAVAGAVVIAWNRRTGPGRAVMSDLATMAAVGTVVGAWWYVRAYLLYGSATGMVGEFRTAHFAGRRHNLRAWLGQWRLTVQSFWGMWGWLEIPLPGAYYTALAWLTGLSAIPLADRRAAPVASPERMTTLVFWTVLVVTYAAIMAVVAMSIGPEHNNQGRHWMPLVAAPALVLAAACARVERRAPMLARVMVAAWCLVLLAANVSLIRATSAFFGGYFL